MNQHAPAPAEAEQQDGPSLYVGLAYEVDELVMGLNTLTTKVRDLQGCMAHRQPVAMKVALDDIARLSGQIQILAKHGASVVERHVNRRPRA